MIRSKSAIAYVSGLLECFFRSQKKSFSHLSIEKYGKTRKIIDEITGKTNGVVAAVVAKSAGKKKENGGKKYQQAQGNGKEKEEDGPAVPSEGGKDMEREKAREEKEKRATAALEGTWFAMLSLSAHLSFCSAMSEDARQAPGRPALSAAMKAIACVRDVVALLPAVHPGDALELDQSLAQLCPLSLPSALAVAQDWVARESEPPLAQGGHGTPGEEKEAADMEEERNEDADAASLLAWSSVLASVANASTPWTELLFTPPFFHPPLGALSAGCLSLPLPPISAPISASGGGEEAGDGVEMIDTPTSLPASMWTCVVSTLRSLLASPVNLTRRKLAAVVLCLFHAALKRSRDDKPDTWLSAMRTEAEK